MVSKTTKTWFWVLLAALFVLHLSLFFANNKYHLVHALKGQFENALQNATKGDAKKYSDELNNLQEAVTNDKFKPKEIAAIFNDFKTAWTKSTLSPDDCKKFQESLDKAYKPLLDEALPVATNQAIATFGIFMVIFFFARLAIFTTLLRDPISNPAALQSLAQPSTPAPQPPFSLSRTQIAIWITVIGCLYLHLVFWKQGPFDGIISQTALLLMGISAGTLAGAAIIDTSETEQGIPRSQNTVSKNFFYDILSDNNGISIHRFQNLVWTIIAIMVYFYRYNHDPAATKLPELDATLVALTGISSATYLTLKTRENVAPADMIKNLKLQFILEAGLDAAILSAINSAGFEIVNVKDNNANIYKVVSGASKLEYIIDAIKPGSYTLTAEARITVNSTAVNFSSTFNGLIDGKTNPLPIPLKKA